MFTWNMAFKTECVVRIIECTKTKTEIMDPTKTVLFVCVDSNVIRAVVPTVVWHQVRLVRTDAAVILPPVR